MPLPVKNDFPIFKTHPNLVYLDSSAMSQVPQEVVDAITDYETKYRANVHRSTYTLADEASRAYEDARKEVAMFIGAHEDEIIFTSGTTGSLNMLAYMLEHTLTLANTHNITTTVMEHHSAFLPFFELAQRHKTALKMIPITESYTLDINNLNEYIPPETKIVVVTLVSNVLGTINSIDPIVRRAREIGAWVIVDAAQAIGHISLNVRDLDCDFLAFSSHKMCGPTGVGVLFGKRELLTQLYPGYFGGGMVNAVLHEKQEHRYAMSPERYEAGTPHVAGVIGLREAIRYITRVGVQNIHAHAEKLTTAAYEALSKLPGIMLYSPDLKRNAGILSFSISGIHPHDVAQVLGDRGVAVRAGHHCAQPLMEHLHEHAVTRASFYLYNTEDDVAALVTGIQDAQQLFV